MSYILEAWYILFRPDHPFAGIKCAYASHDRSQMWTAQFTANGKTITGRRVRYVRILEVRKTGNPNKCRNILPAEATYTLRSYWIKKWAVWALPRSSKPNKESSVHYLAMYDNHHLTSRWIDKLAIASECGVLRSMIIQGWRVKSYYNNRSRLACVNRKLSQRLPSSQHYCEHSVLKAFPTELSVAKWGVQYT